MISKKNAQIEDEHVRGTLKPQQKTGRRRLIQAAFVLPIALAFSFFPKKGLSQNPADTGLLTKIQADLALIYSWLEQRVRVWNEYIEKINSGLDFIRSIRKSAEFVSGYAKTLKEQAQELKAYISSFERSSGSSLFDMRFRTFSLRAQAVVSYIASLQKEAGMLKEQYDKKIEEQIKDPAAAEEIKKMGAQRSAIELSLKSYDSIAKAHMAAISHKEAMIEAEKRANTIKDPRLRSELFSAFTERSRGEMKAASLEQQALTNELLASILQTLTAGRPLSTDEPKDLESLEAVYDFMQKKSSQIKNGSREDSSIHTSFAGSDTSHHHEKGP